MPGLLMIGKWTKSGKGLFATTATGSQGELYHLIVERVPGHSRGRAWDWEIWCAEWSGTATRHGYASSAKAGMAAAERACTEELMGRALTRNTRQVHALARLRILLNGSRSRSILHREDQRLVTEVVSPETP